MTAEVRRVLFPRLPGRVEGPRARRAALLWRLALFGVVLVLPASVSAGGGPASDAYDGISDQSWLVLHVMADVYVSHNFNQPSSGRNRLRAFDFNSDLPSVGFLRLTLAHKPRRLGFRVDIGCGDTADAYMGQDPAATEHAMLARTLSFVEQAFASIVIPIGSGIAVDVGKFSTPVGLEDNETLTNWNYSRSLIYTWAEPSLHMGIRATYEPTPKVALSLFWLNGWNSNFIDGNEMRSYAVAALWRPREQIDLVLVYMAGLEHEPTRLNNPSLSFRNLLDFYVIYRPHTRIQLALSGDYGNDRARDGVSWRAVASYARCAVTSWLAFAVHGEYYGDPDGFTTGASQSLGEVTLSVDLRGKVGAATMLARGEYRHDGSTAPVFDGSGPQGAQDTLTLGLLTWF